MPSPDRREPLAEVGALKSGAASWTVASAPEVTCRWCRRHVVITDARPLDPSAS